MSRLHRVAAATAALLLVGTPALAQHEGHGASDGTTTANLQGNDPRAFMNNPHMRAFYELSKTTLAPGAPKLDFAAYQQKSLALFGEFGKSIGMKPEAMQDHLKLIPGQTVQIVKDDPHVLDSYDKFIDAMIGPP